MTAIPIRALHPYEVCIAPGLLPDLGPRAAALLPPRQAMLVSDDRVYPLYGPAAEASLTRAGFRVSRFVFPHGEKSKSLPTYTALVQTLFDNGFTGGDSIIALGGGVVGDLAGFAAATYHRGLPYIQVPTTLLSAVDSSVGGKTGVNLPGGKNQVGAFHQPALVLCDPTLLETLPPAEYQNGCAEIIKCALLQSEPLFRAIAEKPVSRQWESVIAACVEIKGDFVQSDEFDTGRRRLLNLGHTVGHAIEAVSGYTVPHGSAVSIGMATATRAACRRGFCAPETLSALETLLAAYGLPTATDYTAQALAAAALAAVEVIRSGEGKELRRRVSVLANSLSAALGMPGRPVSSIFPVVVGENDAALAAADALLEQGFLAPAIRYPTVPRGTARLRITVTAAHESGQVTRLGTALKELLHGK